MSENNKTDKIAEREATAKFRKRCFKLGLVLLIPIGFVMWISLFRDTPLEISKETTYITEPLTADGKRVDYFRALELELYPPEMKTDDNGYRLLVRALGPMLDYSSPDAALQVYEKLGLDPSVPPTMTFEEPESFLQRHLTPETEEETGKDDLDGLDLDPMTEEELEEMEAISNKLYRPWTLDELPMMEPWLKQNGPTLDVLGEAVRKPVFRRPLTCYGNSQELFQCDFLSNTSKIRSFARGLTARANYRIGTGDIDGAIDDIISCHALGRQAGKQGSLVDALVGIAVEGIAKAIPIAGSPDHQPTQAQLQRLAEELQNLPPPCTMKDTRLLERYYGLDALQNLATTEARKNIGTFLECLSCTSSILDRIASQSTKVLGFNWNVVMSRFNMYYDNPAELEKLCDRLSRSNRPLYLSFNVLLPTSRSEILTDYITAMFLGSIDAVQEAIRRLECTNLVQQITLAMLLYEKQHGQLPPAYTVDKDGKPLHSWRVLLLPHLGKEAKELHGKIKLDEPWDSKHNRQFHEAAIPFYQCPSTKLKPGQTTYSVVVGKKTAFQPGKGKTLKQLGPESVNMILTLESPTSGCWMDPISDLTEGTANNALDHGGNIHPGTIIIGQRSGNVTTLSVGVSPIEFRHGLEGTKRDWNED